MNTGLADKRRFVLVLGCLTGIAAVTIDMSLPAFPAMVRELSTSMATGQQVVGLFMAGIALGQIPAGLISDRIGRMPVLYCGIGIFTVAGVAASLTESIELLLLARFVQGLGGSVGVVISRAIVRDISSGAQAARLMSAMVMIFTAAPMLAPIVGAFLVFNWGWRAPFIAVVVFGVLVLLGVNRSLQETHTPVRREHPMRQLLMSFGEFFSHRRSRFGVLLVVIPAAGFITMITSSSAIVLEIYEFPVQYFGFIFALLGLSVLTGSTISRHLVVEHGIIRMLGIGSIVVGIAAVPMLAMAWMGQASFWWFWGSACLFMLGTGFLLPNGTALALDPVPQIAGVAASIVGSMQTLSMATGSLAGSAMYDGTIRNVAIFMGISGVATAITFLLRRLVLGHATETSQEVIRPDH
jgi:DHA1 family bicyclomycin/chloramphenicol resistance-like MFS transporter